METIVSLNWKKKIHERSLVGKKQECGNVIIPNRF